jgi:hypothetical protein
VEFRRHTAGHGDTLQPLQEIDVKEGAAELAVGDALQTNGFLFADDLADGVIFDRTQFFLRNLVSIEARPRLLEMRRPEQTADLVGAERRVEPGHGGNLLWEEWILLFFDRRAPP